MSEKELISLIIDELSAKNEIKLKKLKKKLMPKFQEVLTEEQEDILEVLFAPYLLPHKLTY